MEIITETHRGGQFYCTLILGKYTLFM
jgi:hypothetical protein